MEEGIAESMFRILTEGKVRIDALRKKQLPRVNLLVENAGGRRCTS